MEKYDVEFAECSLKSFIEAKKALEEYTEFLVAKIERELCESNNSRLTSGRRDFLAKRMFLDDIVRNQMIDNLAKIKANDSNVRINIKRYVLEG